MQEACKAYTILGPQCGTHSNKTLLQLDGEDHKNV